VRRSREFEEEKLKYFFQRAGKEEKEESFLPSSRSCLTNSAHV
jgi:uncharacterized protein YccT (UPF0319 family)